jgi:pilus assembly protein CpaE
LILNQVGVPKRPEIPPADFGKAIGVEPSVIIPHDPQSFGLAQGNGQMLFEVAPKSKSAEMLNDLAEIIAGARPKAAKAAKFDLSGMMKNFSMKKK